MQVLCLIIKWLAHSLLYIIKKQRRNLLSQKTIAFFHIYLLRQHISSGYISSSNISSLRQHILYGNISSPSTYLHRKYQNTDLWAGLVGSGCTNYRIIRDSLRVCLNVFKDSFTNRTALIKTALTTGKLQQDISLDSSVRTLLESWSPDFVASRPSATREPLKLK